MICFDIETGPQDETKILDQFDPDSVKTGNLKDPVKIRAKQREAREKFLSDAALTALTGQVLAVGLVDDENFFIFSQGTFSEERVIKLTWEFYMESPKDSFVGFNIFDFDLPFLVRRSWLLGVDVPDGLRPNRYWSNQFIDLRDLWQLGDRQAKGSLDAIDVALGGEGKPEGICGGDFARLFNGTKEQREQALNYLRNDLQMTRRVAEALQVL